MAGGFVFVFIRFIDAGDDAPSQRNITRASASVTTKGRYDKMKESPRPKATMFKLSQNSQEPDKPTQLKERSSLKFFLPSFSLTTSLSFLSQPAR